MSVLSSRKGRLLDVKRPSVSRDQACVRRTASSFIEETLASTVIGRRSLQQTMSNRTPTTHLRGSSDAKDMPYDDVSKGKMEDAVSCDCDLDGSWWTVSTPVTRRNLMDEDVAGDGHCRRLNRDVKMKPRASYHLQYSESTDLLQRLSEPRHPQMIWPKDRMDTFKNWPRQIYQLPKEFVRQGFFYTGQHDKVECAWCGVRVYNWQLFDSIPEEHKKHSPNCPLILMKWCGHEDEYTKYLY